MNTTARLEALARRDELRAHLAEDPAREARRAAARRKLEEDFPAPELPEVLRNLGPNCARTWRNFTAGMPVLPEEYQAAVTWLCLATNGERRHGVQYAEAASRSGMREIQAAIAEVGRTRPPRFLA